MIIDDLPEDKGDSIAQFCNFHPIQLQLEPGSLHAIYNRKFDPFTMPVRYNDELLGILLIDKKGE